MESLRNLVEAAKEKNYPIEVLSNTSDRMTYFGFTSGKSVWYWFKSYDTSSDDNYFLFDHRYNQNNGKSIKTIKQEYKALKDLGLINY